MSLVRLENEHLGNMDQYRVTRDIPLPYSFNNPAHESEGGDEEDEQERMSISSRSTRRRNNAQKSVEQGSEVPLEI